MNFCSRILNLKVITAVNLDAMTRKKAQADIVRLQRFAKFPKNRIHHQECGIYSKNDLEAVPPAASQTYHTSLEEFSVS